MGRWLMEDNGLGFDIDSNSPGMGLSSMRQRAESLPEGKMSIASSRGRGTKLTVSFRLSAD